jgi:nitric oxide reductase NorD protein
MEWDQFIFKKVMRFIDHLKRQKPDPDVEARTVFLSDVQGRLTHLARLLTGHSISISTAEGVGGWKGNHFFLPSHYAHAFTKEENIQFYLFRVFYLYGQLRLSQYFPSAASYSVAESIQKSQEASPEVIQFLSNEFPNFDSMYHQVLAAEQQFQAHKFPDKPADLSLLYGRWYEQTASDLEAFSALLLPVDKKTVADDSEEHTEIEAPSKEDSIILKVDTEKQEEYTLTHNFEKIETIDTFSGRWRNFDGADELEEHAEALQELDLRHLVRVDNPVHSIYKTEFINSLGLVESPTLSGVYHFAYHEWDESRRLYKPDFCKIFYANHLEKDASFTQNILAKNKSVLQQMRKKAERYLTDYHVKKRLFNGDEPDLDAVVEAFVDIQTGHTPSENVYYAKRKKNKDIAILILTDTSLSTDGFSNNRRILDVEKEALILASEVWSQMDLMFQIDTFSSRTHNFCTYTTVKAFHENWAQAKDKVGSVKSVGYTRMGPALRHATYILSQLKVETKWILLISDGKPNDFDRYEGNYGIHDVKQAIREATTQGIHVSAIAIESDARYYLPKMFGNGGYTILQHPNQLPEALTKFYINLLK